MSHAIRIAMSAVWAVGALMVLVDAVQRLTRNADWSTQQAIAILLVAGVGHLVLRGWGER